MLLQHLIHIAHRAHRSIGLTPTFNKTRVHRKSVCPPPQLPPPCPTVIGVLQLWCAVGEEGEQGRSARNVLTSCVRRGSSSMVVASRRPRSRARSTGPSTLRRCYVLASVSRLVAAPAQGARSLLSLHAKPRAKRSASAGSRSSSSRVAPASSLLRWCVLSSAPPLERVLLRPYIVTLIHGLLPAQVSNRFYERSETRQATAAKTKADKATAKAVAEASRTLRTLVGKNQVPVQIDAQQHGFMFNSK